MADFYKMDFMKEIVILVKVGEMYKDEMCKILKFANHCLLLEKWKWKQIVKTFAGVCPWMSIRLLRPSLIKG